MSKDPIAIFMAQHEEGLAHLRRLGGYIQRVERREVTEEVLEGIRRATAFINKEVRVHNEKEEELLFPELEKVLRSIGGYGRYWKRWKPPSNGWSEIKIGRLSTNWSPPPSSWFNFSAST